MNREEVPVSDGATGSVKRNVSHVSDVSRDSSTSNDNNADSKIHATLNVEPRSESEGKIEAQPSQRIELNGFTKVIMFINGNILKWVPLAIALAVSDFRIAVTAAFACAALNMVLAFTFFRLGFNRKFPYIIDCVFLTLFAILTILVWADPKHYDAYLKWSGVLINGGLFLAMSITWICGYPFTTDNVTDNIPDPDALTHPNIRHLVRVTTAGWIVVFLGMTVVGLIGALWPNSDPSRIFVLAFQFPGFVSLIIVGLGFILISWLYVEHWHKQWWNLCDRYAEEVAEWNAMHPNSELALLERDEESH